MKGRVKKKNKEDDERSEQYDWERVNGEELWEEERGKAKGKKEGDENMKKTKKQNKKGLGTDKRDDREQNVAFTLFPLKKNSWR